MKWLGRFLREVFIDGLSGMATGLFATLIIGTIIQQIGNIVPLQVRIHLIGTVLVAAVDEHIVPVTGNESGITLSNIKVGNGKGGWGVLLRD